LRDSGIGFVLNCCQGISFASGETRNLLLPLRDSSSQLLSASLSAAFPFLDEAKESGMKCLVHCRTGISRSVSVVLAYLVAREGRTLSESWRLVQSKVPVARPNRGFAMQLIDLERVVRGSATLADVDFRRNRIDAAREVSGGVSRRRAVQMEREHKDSPKRDHQVSRMQSLPMQSPEQQRKAFIASVRTGHGP
jgi:hypothetical protein